MTNRMMAYYINCLLLANKRQKTERARVERQVAHFGTVIELQSAKCQSFELHKKTERKKKNTPAADKKPWGIVTRTR